MNVFGFVYVVVCIAEAVVFFVLIEEWLMGQKKSPDKEPGIVNILLSIFVLAAIAVSIAFFPVWLSKPDWSQADPYSLLNAGVAALAFAAFIQSLRYQQHQIRLQRRELRLQRKELRQSLLEYQKMAQAQESSDKRLFLAAYVNALDSLRELNSHPPKFDCLSHISPMPAVSQWTIRHRLNGLIGLMASEAKDEYGISTEESKLLIAMTNLALALEKMSAFLRTNSGQTDLGFTPLFSTLMGLQSSVWAVKEFIPESSASVCDTLDSRIGELLPQVSGRRSIEQNIWHQLQSVYDDSSSLFNICVR